MSTPAPQIPLCDAKIRAGVKEAIRIVTEPGQHSTSLLATAWRVLKRHYWRVRNNA